MYIFLYSRDPTLRLADADGSRQLEQVDINISGHILQDALGGVLTDMNL